MSAPANADRQRICKILLDQQAKIRLSPQVEHERRSALYDLIEENRFAPRGDFQGPYVLHLMIEDECLVFDVLSEAGEALTRFVLPLRGLRPLIKDYFLICNSYLSAIRTLSPSRIEAIDMGRRGLHNEGAQFLRERLAEKVEMDMDTARRLFTLICVLHIRS